MKGYIPSNDIVVNTSAIPQDKCDYIAACTIRAIKQFLSIPGNKELMNKRIEERKKRLEAAKKEGAQI